MKKIIFIYGIIAGTIVISIMIAGFALATPDMNTSSVAFGLFIMLVALSIIFVGIKKHRDRDLGGIIKFWPAFGLGIGISVVAALIYAIGWEIYLAATDYVFIEGYTKGIIDAKIEGGLAGADLEALIVKMEKVKADYASLFYRMPRTFIEIFPMGLIVSLVSAAILRNSKILPARS